MSAQQELPDVSAAVIGVLGGTGPQGRGLAYRLASAGQRVLIGSRDAERARHAAGELIELLSGGRGDGHNGADGAATGAWDLTGVANGDVAGRADMVIAAVPWDGHSATLASLRDPLRGKVVVDCVNPIGFDKQGAYALEVPEGSAAEQAQAILAESTVVGAFHHVSAALLTDPNVERVDSDVLVLGDDRTATDTVLALAGRIPGLRGVYAGRLRNCRQVEALTANLISINRRYKSHAGLRVTDV
jgi:NADPH-dependent F420 reductase